MDIPAITADQMREVDRLMVEKYRIELVQMMEYAGRQLAELARERFLDGDPRGARVVVLAGTGGNGGGGLAAARFLANWGAEVGAVLTRGPESFSGVPAQQLIILRRMGAPLLEFHELQNLPGQDLILDALIGYSLSGAPYGRPAELIHWLSGRADPVLSLDLPSGLDPDQGVRWDPYVKADATLTLALPKTGLMHESGREAAGEIFLADIGVPPGLYAELGLQVGPLFARNSLLQLK
jgi:NAD(P)H-hydrate epimerase